MSAYSHFLHLPRELRDIIYRHYVFEVDGYHFHYDSGKLRASNGRLIDLSLMYTCTVVAAEMRHVALENNLIIFSTVFLETERLKAGRFHQLMLELDDAKNVMLLWMRDPTFWHYKTPEMETKVTRKYPYFAPLVHVLHEWRAHVATVYPQNWGEAGSAFRGFIDLTIEALSIDTDFVEAVARRPYQKVEFPGSSPRPAHSRFYRSSLLFSRPAHWDIPSNQEIAAMEYVSVEPDWHRPEHWERIRWRYSAAAAAISFFNSLQQSTLHRLRNVVLCEDRGAVAHPECHGLGLIPFCRENPRLRIERRVSVWRTILSPAPGSMDYLEEPVRIHSFDITKSFGLWITEALALSAAGMPTNSFTLVLDGDPAPHQSAEIFDLVKQDAAWEVAQELWYTQRFTPEWPYGRGGAAWFFKGFPQAISDIVEGKSYICCNFPVGGLYDAKPILERNYDLTCSRDWRIAWIRERDSTIELASPLPQTYYDLRLEGIMPEDA